MMSPWSKNTRNTFNYASYFKINNGVYLTFILKCTEERTAGR